MLMFKGNNYYIPFSWLRLLYRLRSIDFRKCNWSKWCCHVAQIGSAEREREINKEREKRETDRYSMCI